MWVVIRTKFCVGVWVCSLSVILLSYNVRALTNFQATLEMIGTGVLMPQVA